MPRLTAAARKRIPKSQFALQNGVKGNHGKPSFPLNDKAHDEAAIKLAPRSLHAGNISESTEQRIVSEAKKKLGETPASRRHKAVMAHVRGRSRTGAAAPASSATSRTVRKARSMTARKALGF